MVTPAPEILAVIPARGGSQSIPRKNIRQMGGHPLLAWSIAAAHDASLVRRTVVSTDDGEIAAFARSYGAEVPFIRPAELAQNDTRDFPVFRHAIDWLAENEGYHPAIVVQLRPTSPLRPPGLVDDAIRLLLSSESADSVRTVTHPSQNPYKMWTLSGGLLKPLLASELNEPYNAPRQHLPVTYWQTGHIDVFRTRTLLEKSSLTGDRILPIAVDSRYAIDIDTLTHLRFSDELVAEGELDLVKPRATFSTALAGIRLLVFDFDGVFTDDRVYIDEFGTESVSCSRADGFGLERLLSYGIEAAVLSREVNPVVAARCRKLNLYVEQGLLDKGEALWKLAASRGFSLEQIAYVGNDINDLECLRIAGVGVVPADALPQVRRVADLVLERSGGHGAVREICELVIAAHGSTKEEYALSANR